MFVMGLDLGTGGARALVLNTATSAIEAQATAPVELHHPQPGWSQQHPADWWSAACTAIKGALSNAPCAAGDIKAIGLSGQMHGCTLVDAQDQPVTPALLWNDQRTAAQCRALGDVWPNATWRARLGKPPMAGLTLPSLCWIRDHEPDAFAQATGLLLPKDFIRLHLTGERATDAGDGSGTLLLDLHTRDWAHDLCEALALDPTLLPRVVEGPDVSGTVTQAAAMATGLALGTPVVGGGGDQQAGGVGCGITRPGTVSLNLGTSGVIFAALDAAPEHLPRGLHGFCHSMPDRWHVMGVMLAAGGALRWWRDVCGVDYDTLLAEARPSAGVCFQPYLSGERTPHEDPSLTGGFTGLQLHHDRGHMTTALLEGVAFGLRDGLELIRNVTVVDHLRFVGGAASSEVWRQLIADVMGCPVATINTAEGSALGACTLAAVGAGAFGSVDDACDAMVHEASVTHPRADRTADWAAWRDQCSTDSASD